MGQIIFLEFMSQNVQINTSILIVRRSKYKFNIACCLEFVVI